MRKPIRRLLILLIFLLMAAGFIFLGYVISRENFWLTFTVFTFLFAGMVGIYFLTNQLKWGWIFVAGLVLRYALLPAFPSWSDDYYRFLWDGELVKMSENPYSETPEDWLRNYPESSNTYLENLFLGMNSPQYFSVYPPLNQAIFFLAAWGANLNTQTGILILRVILILGEIGVFFLLLKLFDHFQIPTIRLILYWLNPLVIMEITGNLHFEGLVLLLLLASLYALSKNRDGLSGGFWGLSIGMKLLPLMLIPTYVSFTKTRRSNPFWLGSSIAVIASFGWLLIDDSWVNFLQSLRLYQGKFEFNASIYYLLREAGYWVKGYNIIGEITPILSGITLVGIIYFTWKRKPQNLLQLADLWVLVYLIYLVLQPVVHPWYLIPAFGLSLLTDKKAFFIWTFAVVFSYQAYSNSRYHESSLFLFIEYFLLYSAIYWDYFRSKHKSIITT
ncbi:glycosyltransferase 87 family protein [Algoriphagus sp. D3-2-R+10]|uniref:glycosyltransferase 87 family protein n=1 Tax=Algoriphagus aurantiacus TaxID=3103948 RepID=UPI002B3BB97A|nr:glycosyltransferase 87 family protein [Algoriphagus sp. D3-2-R+10]MEB2778586.1 glycosyltransferase 87 family protein [Algoriphagus sp. D3-2-R+10]